VTIKEPTLSCAGGFAGGASLRGARDGEKKTPKRCAYGFMFHIYFFTPSLTHSLTYTFSLFLYISLRSHAHLPPHFSVMHFSFLFS